MADEEINYRVDVKRPDGNWDPWYWASDDLKRAKDAQLSALNMPPETVRDARIVEVRKTCTHTVLSVDAASLDILSREEL